MNTDEDFPSLLKRLVEGESLSADSSLRAFAAIMAPAAAIDYASLGPRLIVCLIVAMALSSANYTINEWLDAPFDAMHPTKRARPAVQTVMSPTIVFAQYVILTAVGMLVANTLGHSFAAVAAVFVVFGVIYNVRPIRAKDRAFLHVIFESLNNPLRVLFGWFAVTPLVAPPVSILLAYWFGGAFLMAAKRVSEHRAIVEAGDAAPAKRTVCVCFGVDRSQIETAIRAGRLTSAAEIGGALKAGTNCGSCIPELKEILRGLQVPA